MTKFLEDAKKALDMYQVPSVHDTWKWDYVQEYIKLSALISIAESLEKMSSVQSDKESK